MYQNYKTTATRHHFQNAISPSIQIHASIFLYSRKIYSKKILGKFESVKIFAMTIWLIGAEEETWWKTQEVLGTTK